MQEANTITNFNFGFSSNKSDVLMHLSQWQYWFWFWFSLCWVLYFFIFIKTVNKRLAQFNPVINTSLRGHGKWGDFLVAIIPLTWCGSILVNSNFILRMIEWQNESSLFTVRVIGRQWYWEYRYDSTAVNSILSAPKNVGRNRWQIKFPAESLNADSYYQALTMSMQLEYKKIYNNDLLNIANIDTSALPDLTNIGTEVTVPNQSNVQTKIITTYVDPSVPTPKIDPRTNMKKRKHTPVDQSNTSSDFPTFSNNTDLENNTNYSTSMLMSLKQKPLTIIMPYLNEHIFSLITENSELTKPVLYTLKFWNPTGRVEAKLETNHLFWGFKQKKKREVNFDPKLITPNTFIQDNTITSGASADSDLKSYVDFVKINKHRGEQLPLSMAKRLLRVKRTLVLPAHVNITIITNSYDVVHSWFIPGLGIKLDCVPGRSTHHSFYIDNSGFYYGQCAEICGRYHHHMPISICALPFEQFLSWWQHKGLHRFTRLPSLKKQVNNEKYAHFRYTW